MLSGAGATPAGPERRDFAAAAGSDDSVGPGADPFEALGAAVRAATSAYLTFRQPMTQASWWSAPAAPLNPAPSGAMLKAPEPPRNRTLTLALLGISVALAIAAGVVGIEDNPPGLLLGLFSAVAFVVAFFIPGGRLGSITG